VLVIAIYAAWNIVPVPNSVTKLPAAPAVLAVSVTVVPELVAVASEHPDPIAVTRPDAMAEVEPASV
jgi:hypothetical protein